MATATPICSNDHAHQSTVIVTEARPLHKQKDWVTDSLDDAQQFLAKNKKII